MDLHETQWSWQTETEERTLDCAIMLMTCICLINKPQREVSRSLQALHCHCQLQRYLEKLDNTIHAGIMKYIGKGACGNVYGVCVCILVALKV